MISRANTSMNINANTIARYGCVGLFSYHYYKGYDNYKLKYPSSLFTWRVMVGIVNGFVSIFPGLPVTLIKDIQRVEIKLTGLDPMAYPEIYTEYSDLF